MQSTHAQVQLHECKNIQVSGRAALQDVLCSQPRGNSLRRLQNLTGKARRWKNAPRCVLEESHYRLSQSLLGYLNSQGFRHSLCSSRSYKHEA